MRSSPDRNVRLHQPTRGHGVAGGSRLAVDANGRFDRDYLQFDPVLGYGLVEYLRIQDMLRQHGWSSRRRIPHGGHQFALHVAAALRLGGNESYPGECEPTGGFADPAVIEHSRLRLTDTPGVGFEDKAELHRVFRALHTG